MKISAVIPTKNRAQDLLLAVKSIMSQIELPNQLIIIDQSDSHESFNLIDKLDIKKKLDLTYILDPKITGLVHAKHVSLEYVKNELVSFLEDDIVLEQNYFKEVIKIFIKLPHMLGCSGTIINSVSDSFLYRFFYKLNHRGIFRDPRPDIFVKLKNSNLNYINSNVINGGLSTWKFAIFLEFKFDFKNKFHMLEDFEFSSRVSRKYPNSLYVISKARLNHYCSPVNRSNRFKIVEMKIFEYLIFYKKNKNIKYSFFDLIILLIGLILIETLKSVIDFNFKRIFSLIKGLKKGYMYKI